jgi:hypothetical protein
MAAMSEASIVAGRVPMSRRAFEEWLETRWSDEVTSGDWDRMYLGWSWDGDTSAAPPQGHGGAVTVRDWLRARVERASDGDMVACLVLHDGESLLFYDAELMGAPPQWAESALAVLRAAAPHAEGLGFGLYWSEPSGKLPRAGGVISMCAMDRTGARFVVKAELGALSTTVNKVLASLRPVDDLWGEYVAGFVSPEDSSPNLMLPKDPRFVDPAVTGVAALPAGRGRGAPAGSMAKAARASAAKPPPKKRSAPSSTKPAAPSKAPRAAPSKARSKRKAAAAKPTPARRR